MAFLYGYLLSSKAFYSFLVFALYAAVLYFGNKYISRYLEKVEIERINYRKGAIGEAIIGYILEGFPDDYRIINDLTTPFGNIDHVAIGPSGAYVIDAKNWRGIISSDGKGELLLNGKPTNKPEVKNLTRTLMNIRDKAKTLSGIDFYIQGVLAFTSAFVEAKWKSTGAVDCVSDDKLYDYIVENKFGKKLSKSDIDSISSAFLALARMDKGFEKDPGKM